MIIDNQLLDQVSGQAKESERLRMNFNLHETLDAKAQRLLNALEVGTVLAHTSASAYSRNLYSTAWAH